MLRLAVEEATELEHAVWGNEHVLLALTKGTGEDSGRPAEILNQLGVTEARLRELIDVMGCRGWSARSSAVTTYGGT